MTYPLEGLKVLDMSRVLAGPFAGRMLCDLGADVVKVEPPDGDMTRIWGAVIGGVPGYYHQQNVGKRDICVDLAIPQGVELVKQLVAQSDMLIENFRPGVMDRLGLGYEELKTIRPDLLMLSISGFGHDSPEARRPAYAPAIHAESGLVARQTLGRGGVPSDVGMSVADTNASLHGLVGLLAALHLREKSGLGQHIDMAMIDATVVTDDQLHYFLEDSHETGPAQSDIWETGAGPILMAGDFRHIWRQLTQRFGVEDPTPPGALLEDKIRLRRQRAQEFFAALADIDAVREAMAAMNLAWGEARDSSRIGESKTVRHRGTLTQVDDRDGGQRTVPQSPYRFSNAEARVRGAAPHRGEHNREVLREWLGLEDAKIDALGDAGALLADEQVLAATPGGAPSE